MWKLALGWVLNFVLVRNLKEKWKIKILVLKGIALCRPPLEGHIGAHMSSVAFWKSQLVISKPTEYWISEMFNKKENLSKILLPLQERVVSSKTWEALKKRKGSNIAISFQHISSFQFLVCYCLWVRPCTISQEWWWKAETYAHLYASKN